MPQENLEILRHAIEAANRGAGAVAQFVEGKIVRVTMYLSKKDALEAAGLPVEGR